MTERSYKSLAKAFAALAYCVAVSTPACAQADADSVRVDSILSPVATPAVAPVDTLVFIPEPTTSSAEDVTNPVDLEKHLTQQPTVALFKSLLVPGLGQLGNRRYIKAGVVAGLEIWLVGKALDFDRQADNAREAYENATSLGERRSLYYEYDSLRKSRGKYAWLAGLTVFVSMFDAYVDAHLSGSPTDRRNEKFSVEIVPDDNGGALALFSCRF
ncbi:MAG: DUF5683 domain-containing protein [Candidatus Zixiibacteriota bacterium]